MKGLIVAASVAVILMISAIALVIINADDTATATQTETTEPQATTTRPPTKVTAPEAESAEPEAESAEPETRRHHRWDGGLPDEFQAPRFGPHGFWFFHGHEDLLGLLDVTPEELMDALAEGTPLIDVIDDPEAFLDSLLAPMEERLNQAVEEGHLTQSEADELLAEARTRAEAFINGEVAEGGWFMGPRGPRGFGDFGEFGPHNRTGSAA